MHGQAYVYIMTNKSNRVLYTGVTSDLVKRVYRHKEKTFSGFTAKYTVIKLVYFEVLDDIRDAISREKQIKADSRSNKIRLIEKLNKSWADLYQDII